MIKVWKKFLWPEKANIIEKDLLGPNFEWYWNESTLDRDEQLEFKTRNTVNSGQFIHKLLETRYNDGNISVYKSPLYEGFKQIFNQISYINIERIKCNLNLNKTGYKKTSHQPIHFDHKSNDFRSLLYYINDSDGDTIFFNKKLKEIKRVKPKKNTAVLFDSNLLHCGCNPIKSNKRAVINFMFKKRLNNDNRTN